MTKAKRILANYDARIYKIKIKPKNTYTKVTILSKMYDEETGKMVPVKIHFSEVATIDFRINYFDCMIGAEACGLYCIENREFVQSVVRDTFERRREVFLLEGDYNYDENDEHDLLNSLDISGEFMKKINQYKAFVQNVDAGVYIIVAKKMRIER